MLTLLVSSALQDVLGRFTGNWQLKPIRDPQTGQIVGTDSELNQDITPKGGCTLPHFIS